VQKIPDVSHSAFSIDYRKKIDSNASLKLRLTMYQAVQPLMMDLKMPDGLSSSLTPMGCKPIQTYSQISPTSYVTNARVIV
jgi:hypothetical protein